MRVPIAERMQRYAESGPCLLPRTPAILEIVPCTSGTASAFKGGELISEVLTEVCDRVDGTSFGYTDYSACYVLVVDYPEWDRFAFRDPQQISSFGASAATAATGKDRINFRARCFNIPKDEVVNYFAWKQMGLARSLIKMHGGRTEPDDIARFVAQGPKFCGSWPGSWWRGRACTRSVMDSKAGPVPFWEIDFDTPSFFINKNYVNSRVYAPSQGQ